MVRQTTSATVTSNHTCIADQVWTKNRRGTLFPSVYVQQQTQRRLTCEIQENKQLYSLNMDFFLIHFQNFVMKHGGWKYDKLHFV
ncbi:Hypothetical predicted protein [Scomber scombrus]